MMTVTHLENTLSEKALQSNSAARSLPPRSPDAWAAYGRFVFESVSQHCSDKVETVTPGLLRFRRLTFHRDLSLVYAFQEAISPDDSAWHISNRALDRLIERESVDHLSVFVAGHEPATACNHPALCNACNGAFVGIANTYLTNEILEFPSTFDEFLMSLGPNNRRHMRGRRNKAERVGLKFEASSDPALVSKDERYRLGVDSRPSPYLPEAIDSWDAYASRQPGFFHCCIRDRGGALLSYSAAIAEADSAVMMYQLNDKSFPDLGLTMMLRGYLIEHCIEKLHLQRIVLPKGISGHLRFAATTNPVTEVFFVRRSLPSFAKAIAMRFARPDSPQAGIVRTPGFLGSLFARHSIAHLRSA